MTKQTPANSVPPDLKTNGRGPLEPIDSPLDEPNFVSDLDPLGLSPQFRESFGNKLGPTKDQLMPPSRDGD